MLDMAFYNMTVIQGPVSTFDIQSGFSCINVIVLSFPKCVITSTYEKHFTARVVAYAENLSPVYISDNAS